MKVSGKCPYSFIGSATLVIYFDRCSHSLKNRMNKGFTILELVIVLSVLVILIGIAIPRIKGMQDSAKMVQVKAELKTLQSAMEEVAMLAQTFDNGQAPDFTKLSPMISPCLFFTENIELQSLNMFPSSCLDPFSPAGAEYDMVGNGLYYAFASVGPGGEDLSSFQINSSGYVTGAGICVTNGSGC